MYYEWCKICNHSEDALKLSFGLMHRLLLDYIDLGWIWVGSVFVINIAKDIDRVLPDFTL